MRFLIPCFFLGLKYMMPVVLLFSILSVIYSSFSTLRQIDLKKIVAYSSIAHMNFVILGLMSFIYQGLEGALFLMISHGLVSSALFFCIGLLYDRYKTRNILYYSGIVQVMPIFSCLFFLLILSNFSFPLSSNFIGEFLVLLALFNSNNIICIFACFSMIFSCVYSLWLYNRICFSLIKHELLYNYSDLSKREFFILLPFIFLIGYIGIYSKIISDYIYNNIIILAYV